MGIIKGAKKGTCLWCESVGPLEEEHIVPRWVFKYLPQGEMRITRETQRGEVLHAWESEVFNLSAHLVCHRCHHTWMNNLETMTIPMVRELIAGKRYVFTVKDREVLAMWAAKTAITYRATQAKWKDGDRSRPTIPRAWLRAFHQTIPAQGIPKPPRSVSVSLALNGGVERFHLVPHPFSLTGRHIVGRLDVDRLTLVLDALVVQVILPFDFQGFYPYGLKAESSARSGIHRIWPDTAPIVGAVSFPPPVALPSESIWEWAHCDVRTDALWYRA